jgi:two-component system chemotaxis response regulator CheB
VTDVEMNKIYNEAKNVFGLEIKNVELKVITSPKNVRIIENNFSNKILKRLKISEKSGQFDIHYFPSLGKLRVSIEPVKNGLEVSKKIKVLIVDDSKTIRTILSKIFSSDSSFIVCAMAEKPSDVEKLILEHKPDVITLDIHMPEMDGVTLLKTVITPKYQIPTVMISSISMVEGPLVLEALENGAVDYIQKPEMSEIEKVTPLILEKVKTAALSNQIKKMKMSRPQVVQTNEKANFDSLIVLGSSTGGTEAIREILTAFPKEIPPMLIVQHIPAVFSLAFAKRMNELCSF